MKTKERVITWDHDGITPTPRWCELNTATNELKHEALLILLTLFLLSLGLALIILLKQV